MVNGDDMGNVLEEVLLEEYDRELRIFAEAEKEYLALPKGSIQIKKINGYEMPYLCYVEKGKYFSKYIPKENVDKMQAQIERRRACKKMMAESKKNIAKLKRIIPKEMLKEYERYGLT
ncbi:MAG: hypothetical protein J5622_02150 [Firmicutes bacterium]|nr:hypothetical protein [Bacillota bacterium]